MSLLPIVACLIGSTALWVAAGAGPSRDAARTTHSAESTCFEALTVGTLPVLQESQAIGDPVLQVETVYVAWADASSADRRPAARTLVGVLNDQAAAARAVHGASGSTVAPLLESIDDAFRETTVAYDNWTEATATLQGRAVVFTRMVDPPPESMAIYER